MTFGGFARPTKDQFGAKSKRYWLVDHRRSEKRIAIRVFVGLICIEIKFGKIAFLRGNFARCQRVCSLCPQLSPI